MIIGGKWVTTEKKKEIKNPYNNDVVGEIYLADSHMAREAARTAKEFRSNLSAYERYEILYNTATEIEENKQQFATSICLESGICIKDAAKEVQRAVNILKVCAEEAKRITGESICTDLTPGAKADLAVTVAEPIGLVCAITPFNRPLNQVVVKLGPAIAANNSILLKPSEKTPLTAVKFAKTLISNGLPEEMVTIVTGEPGEIGDTLVSSPHIDMVTFTGSAEVGEHIARTAGMIKMTFELGDSGALIVMDDGDLDRAVKVAIAGAYSTAGQSCRGIKRLLVHGRVVDDFASRLKEETEKIVIGDPFDPDTDMGVLIDEKSAKLVHSRIQEAIAQGARLVTGGTREKAQILPTVLTDVARDADIVLKETFGPCAPIVVINDIEDAVEYTNATESGLQTGIFTKDIDKALYAAWRLQVGAVVINNGPQFDSPNIPFGGVKKSGIGREGVKYAIREMTTVKTVVLCS